MKWTKSLIQTLRENPGDAEIDSHRLLIRAGLARKVAGGLYAYLPLGMRTLRKIQQIVREEMDRAGALEIVSPILQPAELWRTTGRWDTMGPNMFKLRDRGEHEFALGPTAEEVFTDIAKGLVSSYRQLPVTIYQMQWKFRDETRPRFGLMRSKEFLMKDAYSFDVDAEGADRSYWNMYHAYERIYERCGLKAVPVQADGGDMGDSLTHEFHVLADAGEDGIAFCEGCGYAANLEKAERKAGNGERGTGNGEQGTGNGSAPVSPDSPVPPDLPCQEVPTPGAKTIDQVSAFMGVPGSAFVKSLVYSADGAPVMVCVEGDRDVNEVKLKRFLGAKKVELADFETVLRVTGANAGFVGPVKPADEKLRIVCDIALRGAKGRIVGANKDEFHLKNVDLARDCRIADADYADLVVVRDGDVCAKCGRPMSIRRGIEVGQVFKLGTKYSAAFNAVYKNDKLEEHVMIMGCYGVGVSRTLQAVIEQSHDKDGIIWPASVAPYQVVIECLDPDNAEVAKVSDGLEAELEAAGIDVLVDDRAERPGVKFKDADLIGFPVRVVVGAKGLANGGVEVKRRADDKSKTVVAPVAEAAAAVRAALG
ncbi:MAG: proline--tRNA ligase [Kiritimatiellae bacterium]|nr:proline--tRNA ligase [Kiritimatiellia bacterium]